MAQIAFLKRRKTDKKIQAVNVSIGNVSLPMHPAMQQSLKALGNPQQPFADGVVGYTETVGTPKANATALHLLAASGINTKGLQSLITNGGSQAMELAVLGTTGKMADKQRPLLLIDAAYANYLQFATRLGVKTVSITRLLQDNGEFSLPTPQEIEQVIAKERPSAVVVIPYDNPTGQFYTQSQLVELAKLCVKHDLWLISDEAYRELFYVEGELSSVWKISEQQVPGITGRRIGIESTSKVWNACGLRIGSLVTDNPEFHQQAVAENTANLSASAIGQEIFSALGEVSVKDLQTWFAQQRTHYKKLMTQLWQQFQQDFPEAIMSKPNAAIYSVIDLKRVVPPDFQAGEFVLWCASQGKTTLNGKPTTLLASPMAGFYSTPQGQPNPGRTQLRISYVETPAKMKQVPKLLKTLLTEYLKIKS